MDKTIVIKVMVDTSKELTKELLYTLEDVVMDTLDEYGISYENTPIASIV